MQVHQVIDDPTLQVVLDTVDDDLLADIHNFQVCEVTLIGINCLVHLLVVTDAVAEVLGRNFGVLTSVVGGRGLYFENIAHDELLVVTLALDKQSLNTFSITSLLDPPTSFLGAVSSIKDGDYSILLLEPLQHVNQCSLSSSASHTLALCIALVEEVCGRLWSIASSVVAYIEDFGIDGKPLEVTLCCEANSSTLDMPLNRTKQSHSLHTLLCN